MVLYTVGCIAQFGDLMRRGLPVCVSLGDHDRKHFPHRENTDVDIVTILLYETK